MNVLELHERTEEMERRNCQKIFQQKFQDTPRKQPRTNSLYENEDNQGKTARHTAGREMAPTEQKPEQL